MVLIKPWADLHLPKNKSSSSARIDSLSLFFPYTLPMNYDKAHIGTQEKNVKKKVLDKRMLVE